MYAVVPTGEAVTGYNESEVFDGLSFGTYDVHVIDSRGCASEVLTIHIDQPTGKILVV